MSTVSVSEVVRTEEEQELALPAKVQEALGELVHCAKEGLLALSVGVGLGLLAEMLEEEVDEVVGPKGKHNPERTAVRHGHEDGEVTLGGRRVAVKRPRVRSAEGESEVELSTYRHFADRDPLSRLVLEQMLAGVSVRRFSRTREPVGEEIEATARATSKSAISRDFVARTKENLMGLMSRPLADIRLAALMLDGIELKVAAAWSRWASTPTGSSIRSACGTAPPRTRPSRASCSPISSRAVSISSRVSCA